MGTWINNDGLYIKYNDTEATAHSGGEIAEQGIVRAMSFELDITDLTTSNTFVNDVCFFDKGIRVENVAIDVIDAVTTSSSACLNLGFISTDRSTAYNASTPGQAMLAALPAASMATKGLIVDNKVGSTYVGNLVGSTLTKNGLLIAATSTGTFTAGYIVIRAYFTVPNV